MGNEPTIKIAACPHCGRTHPPSQTRCESCGTSMSFSGVGERATLPSEAAIQEAQAAAIRGSTPDRDEQADAIDQAPASVQGDAEEPTSEQAEDEDASSSQQTEGPEPDAPSSDDGLATSSDMSMAKGEWKLTDDDHASAAPDPLIGLVVAGRYRIKECIGRGGMGVVYRVEHTEIGKLLALKLLAGELSRQKDVVRRFKREALLASKLMHPNSVQVFDFGVSEGLTFLVMELVVGRDLSRIIKAGPVQSPRLAKIMVQVCSSLAEAHAMGIVHRDMKPENIVVARTRDGGDFAKVLDFGLAKLRESPDLNVVTGTGQVVGTPFYMAPEQIHGNPVDGRADIYSLGSVMYEALTGETVFRGASPMAVFTKHLTEAPVPPSKRAPNCLIPPAMDTIVMRCLEKSPDRRYQRVEELQQALVDHLGGQSGVDSLLNSARLQALQADLLSSDSGRDDGMARTLLHGEVATRDEVTAFKRKLARQRWFSVGVGVLIAGGLAYAGSRAYRRATAKPPFSGLEEEPNNLASEATLVPFGRSVRGMLGKRIDRERSDRDFYRIDVPPDAAVVSISNTSLPNMATCLWVYREGDVDPRWRFCTGGPDKLLSIPALRVESGPHLFAVMQDRRPYDGGAKPMVYENVSDAYELTVSTATPSKTQEVEPNDVDSVATPVPAGGTATGRFDWVGDVDLVCAWPQESGEPVKVRWSIADALERTRDLGAVLEVTPLVDGRRGPAIRLHRAGTKGEPSITDVVSPWTSDPFEVTAGSGHCVRLQLTGDPWAGNDAPVTPPISPEEWKVHVEKVDE